MEAKVQVSQQREKGYTNVEVSKQVSSTNEAHALVEEFAGGHVPLEDGTPLPSPDAAGPGLVVQRPRVPYFDMGDAKGKVGDVVEVPVIAGCIHPIDGFHVGGGCGYRKLKAVDAVCETFLSDYFHSKGLIPFTKFQFVDWDRHSALPEEWWEFAVGFFSMSQEKTINPIPVPSGTHLFTVKFEILPQGPGTIELTMKDNYYYTQSMRRRRDWTYTYSPQGYTDVDLTGGKIEVIE